MVRTYSLIIEGDSAGYSAYEPEQRKSKRAREHIDAQKKRLLAVPTVQLA